MNGQRLGEPPEPDTLADPRLDGGNDAFVASTRLAEQLK